MGYIRDKIKYFGLRTLIKLTLMVIFSACTKENWNDSNIQIGYQFHYDVNDDNRPYTGPEPINPWTIDSRVDGAIKGEAPEWWCHSANGVSKMFDAPTINKGNPHKVN